MSKIDIVGGIYRERCAFPYWDQLFGSAGRAASALSGLVETIRLHSALSETEELTAEAMFSADLRLTRRPTPIEFDYLHTLAVPKISLSRVIAPVAMPAVTGDVVMQFGMMESEPRVTARYAIYDPQSAVDPLPFSRSGSTADHLAIIANRGEIAKMARTQSFEDAVASIFLSEKPEVLIVKDGMNGATVIASGQRHHIPAFKATSVFTIGSGDVFVAAFSYAWAINGMRPEDAARFASLSTAHYVETRALPIAPPAETLAGSREVAVKAGGRIYLAGPFRETGQRMLIDDARVHLRGLGMDVFSPIHDIGPGGAELVVRQDLDAIRQCDAVFAILNGSSPGTVFEVGYARALGKPVFCVTQNMRDVDLKLPKGAGAFLHDDYVSALHHIAWR
ncbi:PfkB family carbohydrate kinase [Neorhizobium galegae]|uniref:PfkB family carbohydrate kinase n=1 Tax=Neorhizobium galegae TaxID=399 RepID=UPI0021067990|nr:PfkB family carbohydrate kinase [Neorhizobium galegae]MCQ1779398.1 PfkB family carbohydrate kinase [Neorhizobium galegae]MCQ1795558.1 PfkB family carbohydrate kinase [Neorhizobium galegae]